MRRFRELHLLFELCRVAAVLVSFGAEMTSMVITLMYIGLIIFDLCQPSSMVADSGEARLNFRFIVAQIFWFEILC
jgi:hypothetical protein